MARFYTDEDMPYPVTVALRQMENDVLTCEEAGRAGRGIEDPTVLADAAEMGRIMITRNRKHFKRLHDGGQFHCGLVLCHHDPDFARQAHLIVSQCEGQPHGAPWLVVVRRGTLPGEHRGGLPRDPHD